MEFIVLALLVPFILGSEPDATPDARGPASVVNLVYDQTQDLKYVELDLVNSNEVPMKVVALSGRAIDQDGTAIEFETTLDQELTLSPRARETLRVRIPRDPQGRIFAQLELEPKLSPL